MREAKNDGRWMGIRTVDIVEGQIDGCTESQEEETDIISCGLLSSNIEYLRHNDQRIRRCANKDNVCGQLYQFCYDQSLCPSELA